MIQRSDDDEEFTVAELREALVRVGEKALREAFAAGLPVAYLKDGNIIQLYSDGTEIVLKKSETTHGAGSRR